MKKKVFLSIAFVISLLPMFLSQYGGGKGVQEISGMINLFNPIGILSAACFAAGVWIPMNRRFINKLLGAMGVIGMVVSELYKFFTWHVLTVTGEISLQNSLDLTYPAFYAGLAVSLVMVIAYFVIEKRVDG